MFSRIRPPLDANILQGPISKLLLIALISYRAKTPRHCFSFRLSRNNCLIIEQKAMMRK